MLGSRASMQALHADDCMQTVGAWVGLFASTPTSLSAASRRTAPALSLTHITSPQGQALAALAQLATLTVESRAAGSFETWRKTLRGGRVAACGPSPAPRRGSGTRVSVADFARSQPVRRRVLLADAASGAAVEGVRRRLAALMLGWPEVELAVEVAGGGLAMRLQQVCARMRVRLCRGTVHEQRHKGAHSSQAHKQPATLCTLPAFIVLPLYLQGRSLSALYATLLPDIPADALRPVSASTPAVTLDGCASALDAPCSSGDQRLLCVGRRAVHCARLDALLDAWFAHAAAHRVATRGAASVLARSTRRARPAYMLRLACPRGAVDVGSEADKSAAVFRDWPAVAAAVMDALAPLWGPPPAAARAGLELGGTGGSGGGGGGSGSRGRDGGLKRWRDAAATAAAAPFAPRGDAGPPSDQAAHGSAGARAPRDWATAGVVVSHSRSLANIAPPAAPAADGALGHGAAPSANVSGSRAAQQPGWSSHTQRSAAPPQNEPRLGAAAGSGGGDGLLGLLQRVVRDAEAAAASSAEGCGAAWSSATLRLVEVCASPLRGSLCRQPPDVVRPVTPPRAPCLPPFGERRALSAPPHQRQAPRTRRPRIGRSGAGRRKLEAASAAVPPDGERATSRERRSAGAEVAPPLQAAAGPAAGVGAAPAWPSTALGGGSGSRAAGGDGGGAPILSVEELGRDAAARGRHAPPLVPATVAREQLARAVALDQVRRGPPAASGRCSKPPSHPLGPASSTRTPRPPPVSCLAGAPHCRLTARPSSRAAGAS